MATDDLQELKASLLRRLRVDVENGDDAFDRHLLLAARIHRVAKLNQTIPGDRKGWIEFFTAYFPSGRNSEADAKLLFERWRVGLLKEGTPLAGVSMTHRQPGQHWRLDSQGALCIDLESMWDDFEYAVDQFINALAADEERAEEVLELWRERTWTVRPFMLLPQTLGTPGQSRVTTLLPVGSVTAANPPPKV